MTDAAEGDHSNAMHPIAIVHGHVRVYPKPRFERPDLPATLRNLM
jgi:hypothetical protein